MDKNFKFYIKTFLNSYSEIFFLENTFVGLILFFLTFININLGIAGVISLLSAYLFAKFINMEDEFLSSGFYTYNPLLVGLSIGFLFKISLLTIFMIVASSIITLLTTITLYNIFSYYFRLPILSLPFVFISSTVYLAVSNYSNLFVSSLYPKFNFSFLENYLPLWLTGYLKSLGTILFIPDVLVGIVIAIAIFFSSRILFLLSLVGYYVGTIISSLLTGSFYQEFVDLSHFNFILISMALGGVFLIPSLNSYFIAVIGVIASTILLSAIKTFWALYGIPAFTLPFNFVSVMFLYVLGIVSYPYIAKFIRKTPEETLDFYLTNINRFKFVERTIYLPFSGKWTVWQGFNGKWTHKGSWKYAYDFIITDEKGNSYKNDGSKLTDYYAYRKPVLSPVRGRVVKVISHLPDNPIGETDKENNWGNLVVIYDVRGFYVEISHFSQNSISVKEGDWVEVGTYLGLCGNSGYSPQPHIHIQVQVSSEIASYTLPFSFASYISNNKFFSNNLPNENQIVEPVYPDKSLDIKFSFILDGVYRYEVLNNSKKIDEFELTVKMALDGTFYFETKKGKLYFGKRDGTFYFYRLDGNDKYLKLIFNALPKLPLSYKPNMEWEDFIPIKTAVGGVKKSLILLFSSFYHNLFKVRYSGRFLDENKIEGYIEFPVLNIRRKYTIELDKISGIKEIQCENLRIVLRGKE